jgi:hypothetical protein
MHAFVVSYSGTSLVVNVDTVEGTGGPFTAWTINVGGLLTAQGALLEVNNLSDVSNPATALTNIGGVPTSRTISAGTGLTGGGDLTANRTLTVSYGTTSGTACEGNDVRLSDARTPLSHTHPASAISDSTGSGRTLLTSNLVGARAHLSLFPSFANRAAFPVTGEVDRVYTALDTFKTYVWVTALSDYVEISPNIKSDWNATSGDAAILNKPTLGTAAAANTTDFAPTNLVGSPIEFVIAASNETPALTAGAAKVTFRAPVAFRLTSVSSSVTVAPTGSTLIVDINNGANSVLSTKLSIDATEKTSATAATPAVIDATYRDFSQNAEITIDIDQVGSTVAGAGLKVILGGTRL